VRFVASLGAVVVAVVAGCSSSLQPGSPADASSGGGGNGGARGNDGGSGPDVTYPVWFKCLPDGGPDCPSDQPCPEVPLSSGSCGDLPGVLGHPATPQTVGHPIGCGVGLSYGNPYYGNTQVECTCTDFADMVLWQCPI
jgi:hypothetical protein